MKKLFQSFYGKLSIAFLVLLVLMAAVQIYFTVQSSIAFVKEADQRMNKTLARDIAVELEPMLGQQMDMPKIQNLLHYLMVINPAIEIYLLDQQGKIVAFFAEPAKKVKQEYVDLGPIHEFIDSGGEQWVIGPDPRHVGVRKTFSAAPIALNDHTDGYIYVILGGEQFERATGTLWDNFLISTAASGLLIALICTAIIGLVLFFFMTRRIRRMNAVVRQFESGDFAGRIPDASHDEFGQLAGTFNQMADRIVSDMDELKRTDDLRRELIANVSHDLRSPLASVQGYLETILMKYRTLSPEQLQSYLEISLNNINNLTRLVQELFELSKLDACQIEPKLEPCSVSELVQDVVMKARPRAEQKSVALDAILHRDLPMVSADIGMIERVLSNLIDNAIQYTPSGGRVTVEPSRHNSGVRVEVSDTGSGIPEADLPHIFDRFYRGTRTGEQSGHGTGLGLAIARKILELHRSDISVQTQVGAGTTFAFTLHASEHVTAHAPQSV